MDARGLVRRFTHSKEQRERIGEGEHSAKLVKSLLKALEAYTASRTPERLADISTKVGAVWKKLLNIEKAASPPKKMDLAEEILLRPDVLKLLLMVFRLVHIDVKRKIRDLYLFVIQWCSNDSPESSVPRTRATTKINPKVRDQLFYCREEISEIIAEGHDEPGSVLIYNDIIREFVKDDVCLASLLIHHGLKTIGFATRPNGCTWAVFQRLQTTGRTTHLEAFDVTAATFDALEMIFLSKHEEMAVFLEKYFLQFCFVTQNLIDCANFYVQARGLRFLYNVINSKRNHKLRWKWLCEPSFVRAVMFCLRSTRPSVRKEAVPFLELILEHHFNPTPVYLFIQMNRQALIRYCAKYGPKKKNNGEQSEYDDGRFERIAYKMERLGKTGPYLPMEQAQFEKAEMLQAKMREEHLVPTSFQDFIDDLPTTRHDFNLRRPIITKLHREPITLGAPPAPTPPNTATSTAAPSTSDA